MELKDWMDQHTDEEHEALASACKTSVGYLIQLAGGHRKASHKLAKLIEIHTKKAVTRLDLRPDIYGDLPEEAA